MRQTRPIAAAALIAVFTTAGAATATGDEAPARWALSASAAGVQASPAASRSYPSTVTLVTGDRVTVPRADATAAAVQPAKGRERMTFATSVVRGHLMVVPADAASLVRADKVDRRLFDITELIESGYSDTARETVPLLLRQRPTAAAGETKRTVRAAGARVERDLPAIHGVAVTVRKDRMNELWSAVTEERRGRSDTAGGVQKVWLDGMRRPLIDSGVPQIGAPAAWRAGHTGRGMTVAVLDTGVDTAHPDLAGRVMWKNFTTEEGADPSGHGTHVASTIAGAGTASGGKYKGVAPEATVLAGKVCTVRGCPDSSVLAGMQWAATEQHARVVNVSLGERDQPGIDPLEEAINTLTAQTGTLFVVAAGNLGPNATTVQSPGSADAALTVGAVDDDGQLADFSGRGPRTGDGALKPDVTAPGVGIVAARAAGTKLGEPAADFPDSYVQADGTSMATPHAAGAAILLAQIHPTWTAPRLKAALMATADRAGAATAMQQGAGRINVARAISEPVAAEPPSLSFGLAQWPHSDDVPLTRTVTYRNSGSADLPLELRLAVTADGNPAPDGVFTLSTRRIEVPAGGTASVTVTADTRGDVSDAVYGGWLIATGGQAAVAVPIAVDKEPERYSLTLRHIGVDGKPATAYLSRVYQPGGDYFQEPYDASGTVTLRVPKGRYTTSSNIDTSATGDGSRQALLFQPLLDIEADTTVTFDARTAAAVSQRVPPSSARSLTALVAVSTRVDGQEVSYGAVQPGFDGLRIGRVGPGNPAAPLTGFVGSTWVRRDSGDHGVDSPYAYHLAEHVPADRLLSGYAHSFTARELAVRTQRVHNHVAGQAAQQQLAAIDDNGGTLSMGLVAVTAPGVRTNHYSTTPGVRWTTSTMIGTPTEAGGIDGIWLSGPPRAYRPRSRSTEQWGAAPYGPVFNSAAPWFYRESEMLVATVPPVGDVAGHVGFDTQRSVTTTLYRDGELVTSSDTDTISVAEPPQQATYRVEQTAGSGAGPLATAVRSVFTFVSASPPDQARVLIPVFSVRYTPRLDHDGVARGRSLRVPLLARDQAGDQVSVRKLTLEISYDDGRTWRLAKVTAAGTGASFATVSHPRRDGFASLRIHAEDATGTAVSQTVIRAYRYTSSG